MQISALLAFALALSPTFAVQTAGARGPAGTPEANLAHAGAGVELELDAGELTVRVRDAAGAHWVGFRLESIHVGATPLTGLALDAPAVRTGREHRLRRSDTVVEVLEERREGIEQSFVFDELPHRDGPLVVAGRLTSDLPLPSDITGGDRIDLRAGVGPGLSVSRVLGIDAAGRTCPGTLNLRGDRIEFVLPAEFVATASLPLVLDPLYGDELFLDTIDDRNRSDEELGTIVNEFVVVFESKNSVGLGSLKIGTFNIWSALLEVGPIKVADAGATHPSIGLARAKGTFLVAWEREGDVTVREVEQAHLGGGIPLLLGPGSRPDVASNQSPEQLRVVVTYESQGQILAVGIRLQEQGLGQAQVDWVTVLSEGGTNSEPAITTYGSDVGRYLVTWSSAGDPEGGEVPGLEARVLDIDGQLRGQCVRWSEPGRTLERPAVDGNAEADEWLVAYESRSAPTPETPEQRRLRARKLTFENGSLQLAEIAPRTLLPSTSEVLQPASVARFGERYVVAWGRDDGIEDTPDGRLEYVSLDAGDCTVCEARTTVGRDRSGIPRIHALAHPKGDGVTPVSGRLFTSDRYRGFDATRSFAQRFSELGTSGSRTDLGGGCGQSGTGRIEGSPALGSTELVVRLDAIPPSATLALLNVTASPETLPCGPCEWLPFATVFTPALLPDGANQRTAQALQVPCVPELEGATYHLQWTVLDPAASPCTTTPGVSLSGILELTLGY